MGDDNRRVVSATAVAQTTRRQVEHTDEHGDEDVRVVTLTRRLIDGLHDTGRIGFMRRERTEQRVDYAHHHRRWCTLATDITDTEEQLLVAEVIVIQVATHLTGRYQ